MRGERTMRLVGYLAAVFGAATAALEGLGPAGAAGGAVVGLALALACSHPRAAWLVAAAAVLALAPLEASLGVVLLVAVHAFFAALAEPRVPALAALAALAGALLLGTSPDDGGIPMLIVVGTAWGTGAVLRERELVAAQLAERARELESEREVHAELSVRYERARIASELHDIVAHAISLMVVQAGAGQRLAARDPAATRQVFETIAGAARQAEQDMARLVALLADEDATGPAPDLALIEELVARSAGSGLDVTLRLEGDRDGLPADVVEVAYRVVQEGLTNALRYAAGAAVTVLVRGEPRALVVELDNGPAPAEAALAGAGTGNGLRGLRERVSACGGTLEAGPAPGGGWRVRARLPRRVAAAAPARSP
jgi:signal transduction histidine kinase